MGQECVKIMNLLGRGGEKAGTGHAARIPEIRKSSAWRSDAVKAGIAGPVIGIDGFAGSAA